MYHLPELAFFSFLNLYGYKCKFGILIEQNSFSLHVSIIFHTKFIFICILNDPENNMTFAGQFKLVYDSGVYSRGRNV